MSLRKAAFFDRDGTLIKDVSYLSSFDQIELLPGIFDLCLSLQQAGYLLFVVTNQSGIGRGFFTHEFVNQTHVKLSQVFVEQGIAFEHFYYCPHHPDQNCLCRKPSPGMLLQAAQEYGLDLSCSLMFGDRQSDWTAGEKAGCRSFDIERVLSKFERFLL